MYDEKYLPIIFFWKNFSHFENFLFGNFLNINGVATNMDNIAVFQVLLAVFSIILIAVINQFLFGLHFLSTFLTFTRILN